MINIISRKVLREKRRGRSRKKIKGTGDRPRICVFKSNRYIYAQALDDERNLTLFTVSTLNLRKSENLSGVVGDTTDRFKSGKNIEAARKLGELLGKRCQELGIKKVVFDRAGYPYHGRIAALCEEARKFGLEF